MDSTGEILSWQYLVLIPWKCDHQLEWDQVSPAPPCPTSDPKISSSAPGSAPASRRRRAVRVWRCLALPGCLHRSPPGSVRAGREYTNRRNGALEPGMCKRGVTVEFLPCVRLRSTLSQNTLSMGSNFLEQNPWLISSHLFIGNSIRKWDRKTQKFILSSCNPKTKKAFDVIEFWC